MSMNATQTVQVKIPALGRILEGDLVLPTGAEGIVVFAHGSGSSRFSRRNRYVAQVLNEAGLGTLLFDLLTPEEQSIDDITAELRFDIGLLTAKLNDVVEWVRQQSELSEQKIGLFGASTGAAAALATAAAKPETVAAVVSRGGRPDLAGDALPEVQAPTLLIIGGEDSIVIDLNQDAARRLRCDYRLEIVPGATHLFEEPGTLEQVARLARDWFSRYLKQQARI